MMEPQEMRSITNQTRPAGFSRIAVFVLIILTVTLFITAEGKCENNPPVIDFLLTAPSSEVHRQYLGLTSEKNFALGEIKAEVVIIEIFSMYCPICQRGAEGVNALFRLIQSKPALRKKIKLIGIGAGNSIFEVDFFKEKYAVEFPLFSDMDFSIHKKVGGVRTPHFFGLLLKENGRVELFYSRTGEISGPESFLQTIIKESGIKEQP